MRVLIVQRSLSPPGGGNAVAAWMVQALAGHHEVATLTERAWSAARTNTFYGTAIDQNAITAHVVPFYWRALAVLDQDRLTRLRMSALIGRSHAFAQRYDLLITADNYAAFKKPGIQFVHFPAQLEPAPTRLAPIVSGYFSVCDAVLGTDRTNATLNLTLANSEWTARGIEQLGELAKPTVLYPPVLDPGAGRPWRERDEAFLIVGRFTPAKRIELAISIVRRIRMHSMPQARLIIVGSAVDTAYTSRIRKLAAQDRDWIELREDLPRAELYEVMRRTRYGIHAMDREHFGLANAEMTRAGCLVFGHASGGSIEVLNREPSLLWSQEDEAVQRITDLAASDDTTIQALRTRLLDHAETYSTGNFVRRFRDIVRAQVS